MRVSRLRSAAAVFLAGFVAIVAAATAALPAQANLAGPCGATGVLTVTSGVATCTYTDTTGEDTFTTPSGVASVVVSATGAAGGSWCVFGAGQGGTVSATFSVSANEVLTTRVATPGESHDCAHSSPGAGGAPGGGNGGSGANAQGGGGASYVRTGATLTGPNLLLVGAGGGGGTGAGNGGSADHDGGQGINGGGGGGTGFRCGRDGRL